MADAIPNQDSPSSNEDIRGELESLRGEIQALKQERQSWIAQAVQQAKAAIIIQQGQNCQISGSNGNYTINVQRPTNGTVTGFLDCTQDPPVLNGTVQFS